MMLFIYYPQWEGSPYPGSNASVPRRGPPSPPVGINNYINLLFMINREKNINKN